MKHFMSNPCGFGNCMDWECDKCIHFKPRYRGIPVPRWLGKILYDIEENRFLKEYAKEHKNDEKSDF
jgi:hypothetical protein